MLDSEIEKHAISSQSSVNQQDFGFLGLWPPGEPPQPAQPKSWRESGELDAKVKSSWEKVVNSHWAGEQSPAKKFNTAKEEVVEQKKFFTKAYSSEEQAENKAEPSLGV